jgi:hypothetical protein
MKKSFIVLGIILLMGVGVTGVLAQPQGQCPGSPAWPMGQMYNPKTVETLDGKIESMEKVTAGRMDLPARVLLKLKTDKGMATIYLGPEWYLDQQKAKLSPGDYIQVRGSRVTMENQTVILPNDITKGSQVLHFWDDQGRPRWRGQGPGRQQQ